MPKKTIKEPINNCEVYLDGRTVRWLLKRFDQTSTIGLAGIKVKAFLPCHQKEVEQECKGQEAIILNMVKPMKIVAPESSWEKDTLKEWIDVFDLDLEDSRRMATLIDIIVKKAKLEAVKEERERIINKIKELRTPTEQCTTGSSCEFENGVLDNLLDFLNH